MGLDASEQAFLDKTLLELDGTDNKSRLGANAMLAVSMAVAKATAEEAGLPLYRYFGGSGAMQLPVPMMNIVNGGAHANNSLDIQEFMIVPVSQPTFREALRCGAEVFHALKKILSDRGMSTAVGDEGGFAPNFGSNDECLSTILQAIEKAGYRAGEDVLLALDCAASGSHDGKYQLAGEGLQLVGRIHRLPRDARRQVPDRVDRGRHHERLGRLEAADRSPRQEGAAGRRRPVRHEHAHPEGIEKGIANSILIKINQIGTLTETFAAIEMAKRAGYTAVISHRSGETEDSTIADIAVGLNVRSDQDGFAVAQRISSTTSCCASRKISATSQATRVNRLCQHAALRYYRVRHIDAALCMCAAARYICGSYMRLVISS